MLGVILEGSEQCGGVGSFMRDDQVGGLVVGVLLVGVDSFFVILPGSFGVVVFGEDWIDFFDGLFWEGFCVGLGCGLGCGMILDFLWGLVIMFDVWTVLGFLLG